MLAFRVVKVEAITMWSQLPSVVEILLAGFIQTR